MKLCCKRNIIIACLILCLLMQIRSVAQQQYVYAAKPLTGDSIAANKNLTVRDTVFYDTSLNKYIAKTFNRSALISLSINESVNKQIPDTFTASVAVTEIAVNEAGNATTKNDTLTISYSKNNPYNSRAVRMFSGSPGYPGVQVQIKNITVAGAGATLTNVKPFLKMENVMTVNRAFTSNCSAITAISTSDTSVATAGELSVSWTGIRFIPVYDLEWTYIDKSALDAGTYNVNGQLNAALIFKNNASRITTTATQYRIPLLYDGDGSLFWRVRTVQYGTNNELINSAWSADASSSGLGRYDFTGHERKLNWQATTSFAEEGKRKSVVQYFDGSLKGRQTVTKDNTTGTTVVAETFYDKQGRPAIQVLPAPTLDRLIKYTPKFNTINNAEYDKNQYDSLISISDYCVSGASPMDTSNGASKYYSPANSALKVAGDPAYDKFIPDAKKYPFTETRYTRDNTGRIQQQGGVGAKFRIGSDTIHTTKYYYGTPTQEDLDALFGTEAGDFSHYQKNMVRDANGQYSVSYVDMSGHTVATALTGSNPVMLQQLGNYSYFNQVDSVLTPTNNVIKDGTIQMSNSLLVPQEGDYIFHYNLSPQSLGITDCKNTNICYDCLYDLNITITNECGTSPIILTKSNFKLFKSDGVTYNLDTTCTAADPLDISDTVHMTEGNYDITKTLSVSKSSMDYYRDSIFIKHNTCRTYADFAASQMDSLHTYLDCTVDSAGSFLTDSYLSQMLADMRPLTGQYGDTSATTSCFSIFRLTTDENSQSVKPIYQTLAGYKNEDGILDSVVNNAGILVPPQQLNQADFIANFRDSWLDVLVTLHPEYSIYCQDTLLRGADIWVTDFQNTNTYDSAMRKGYLNPTGSTAVPANQFTINRKDSLVLNPATSAFKSYIEGFLFNYTQSNGVTYSLWQTATAITKCPNGDTGCMGTWATNAHAFDTSSLCTGDLNQAWQNFRNQYVKKRADWIDSYTKTAANNSYTPPYGCNAVPVFPSSGSLLKNNSLGNSYGSYSGTASDTTVVKNNIQQYLSDNSKAYASRWWQQLAPCGYTAADSAIIVSYLTQVCYEGSDADHPLGSSTVKPSSTYRFRSFSDVIKFYNDSAYHSNARPSACSAYLIDKPTTYDQPAIIVNKPLMTAPDSCTCSRINSLYNSYMANPAPYGSFSAYMQMAYHTSISQSALDSLRNLCSVTNTCRYLANPITIPPALQCNTGNVCATCYTIQSWKDSFTATFPALIPLEAEADSTQHLTNQLFANYMNLHLGFSKSSFDYLSFLDSCPASAKQPPQPEHGGAVCDSLNNIISQFDCYYKSLEDSVVHKGTCGQTYWAAGAQDSYDSNTAAYYSSYLPELIQNGAINMPAPAANKIIGGFTYSLMRPICINNAISVEYRIKNPTANCTNNCAGDVAFVFGNHSNNNNPSLQDEDFYFDMLPGSSGGFYTYRHGAQNFVPALCNRNFDDWHTVKLVMTAGAFTVYYDGSAILTKTRDNNSTIDQVNALYFTVWGKAGRAIDWVKVSVPGSGGTDQLVYSEDFNGPTAMSRPDPSFLCPKPVCTDAFAQLFNKTYGTSYTYTDLSAKAAQGCNSVLNVCNPAGNGTLIAKCDSSWTVYNPGTSLSINSDFYQNSYNNLLPVSQFFGNSLFTAPATGDDVLVNKKDSLTVSDTLALMQWRVHLTSASPDTSVINPFLRTGNDTYTGATWVKDPVDANGYIGSTIIRVNNGRISGMGLQSRVGSLAADWVRVSKMDGTQLYFEDFTGMCGNTNTGNPYMGVLGTADQPLLCDKRAEDSVITMNFSPCKDTSFEAAKGASFYFELYLQRLRNNFNQQYMNKCLSAVSLETFTVTHPLSEYQHTLYYYDEAGNLIKTIPPAGVNPNRTSTWLQSVRDARRNGAVVVPPHTMATTYRYNSLNQVVSQKSPDGGLSHYWYDILGRLAVSQNAKQAGDTTYSYTLYDSLGRITEVGQKKQPTAMTDATARSPQALQTWLNYTYTVNGNTTISEQVTATVYDKRNPQIDIFKTINNYIINASFQKSYLLRNRVSYTQYYDVLPWTSAQGALYSQYDNSSTFSYDIHGNVDTLLLNYRTGVMAQHGYNQFKTIAYNYDLISGKVNRVYYQPGMNDGMTHRYEYDAENRLTNVYTTDLSGVEEQEARYYYYKHGPLAKAIIGQQQVQGLNYVYTLQGWLKAVNPDSTIEDAVVARSAYNYSLHYYEGDYAPIGTGTLPIINISSSNTGFKSLYNGNIGAMAVNIKQFSQPLVYMYGYDQLNRLMNATTYNGWKGVSTFAPSTINDYKEQLTYDPNGNVQTALRNGNSTQTSLENFTYNYDATNRNKLLNIQNSVGNITSNYSYDAIGEETKDELEGNTVLTWTVYGKIKSVTKTDGTVVTYTYDAAGNRIGKQVTKSGLSSYEWYVRDASGNTMAVYNQSTAGVLTQREVNLYGSTLIGVQKRNIDADAAMLNLSAVGQRGMKQYFLNNHLGNTLSIISDKKYAAVVTGGVVTAWKPDVVSATDYSSFGVSLLGRVFNSTNVEYGFNGKWNEVETGYQNYGMRDYSEKGRHFTSVDPLTGKYPWLTPFQFASNRPIDGIDLDGLEFKTKAGEDAYWHRTPQLYKPNPVILIPFVSLTGIQPSQSDNTSARARQFYTAPPSTYREEEIAIFDPYKSIGKIGRRSVVQADLAISKQEYYNAIGDNIAGGPFGAAGYKLWGDKGSYAGAPFDQMTFALGGVPGEGFLSKTQFNAKIEPAANYESELNNLQDKFTKLAETNLIPKYKKLDPNLKAGFTGSFNTGLVGNPNKETFGQPIDLKNFDIDFWIESDKLYQQFGSNLRADPEFRKILSKTPGFEGLKSNKSGFSIRFKPSSQNGNH